MKKRMILLSGSGDTVVWFRLEFIDEFIKKSYTVYVLAPDIRPELKIELDKRGVQFVYINLERKVVGHSFYMMKYNFVHPLKASNQ